MLKKSALFITLEGIEGVGKSSQLAFIQNYLNDKQIPHIITREPGGTEIAELIRNIFLTPHKETVLPVTELLLLFAARAQHLEYVIKPALKAGHWVICDRFTDASYAYQGAGRNIPIEKIVFLESWIQAELRPDTVFLLDTEVEVALTRTKNRNKSDRIENEKLDFFQKVRQGYLAQSQQYPKRYQVFDASLPLKTVQENIRKTLDKLIEL